MDCVEASLPWIWRRPCFAHVFAGPQNVCSTAKNTDGYGLRCTFSDLEKKHAKMNWILPWAAHVTPVWVLKWVLAQSLVIRVPNFLFFAKTQLFLWLFILWRTTCFKGELFPELIRVASYERKVLFYEWYFCKAIIMLFSDLAKSPDPFTTEYAARECLHRQSKVWTHLKVCL